MSEAPQSRRARRTAEEEAAAFAGAPDGQWPSSGGPFTGETAAPVTDGIAVSRRDRRRMERLQRPMETWTAEEEMIATGQIPVVTPEVIAQQERAAREKAEAAARDAYLRSQELKALAEAELGGAIAAPAAPAVPAAPVTPPAPAERVYVEPYQPLMILEDDEDEQTVAFAAQSRDVPFEPQVPQLAPEAVAPPVVPPAYEPGGQQPVVAAPVGLDRFAPVEEPAAPVESSLVLAPVEPESLPPRELPHETFAVPTVAAPAAPAAPGPGGDVAATDSAAARAEALDAAAIAAERERVMSELFPPGSSAAALAAADPFAQAPVQQAGGAQASAQQPGSVADAPAAPVRVPLAAEPTPSSDGAEEIRRLAAEAISGIERASQVGAAPVAEAPIGRVPAVETPQGFDAAPSQPTPTMWQQTTPPSGEQPQPWNPGTGQVPAQPLLGGPVQPVQGGPASAPAPWPPVSDATQAAVPHSPWESHPLAAAPAVTPAVDPNAFTPVSAPPPDFSQLINPVSQPAPSPFGGLVPPTGQTPFAPVAGGLAPATGQTPFAPTGSFTVSEPATTGTFPAVRRMEVPEKPDPRSFKWLHLGVIGALMFVLGVVIYNVMLNQ